MDAQVIPDAGRDVQCSNCGNTWFQRPASQDAELAAELGFTLPDEDLHAASAADVVDAPRPPAHEPSEDWDEGPEAADAPQAPPESPHDAAPEPTPAPETASPTESPPEPQDAPDWAAPSAAVSAAVAAQDDSAAAPRRTQHDESILSILREEAEFETRARRGDSNPFETQTELGLEESESTSKSSALRARMARLRGQPDASDPPEPQPEPEVQGSSGKRRDLLPDIEEINSTLRSASEREDDGSVAQDEVLIARGKRAGFRFGFGVILGLVVAVLVLYLLAPMLAQAVPALTPALDGFVNAINSLRAGLDGIFTAATSRLSLMLAQISGGA